MNPTSPRTHANTLPVAGFEPFSTCDWEGQLSATIFTQGCPLACTYCHNPTLIPHQPGTINWQTIEQHLKERQTLLDAIIFSGGEPAIQPALPHAAQIAKQYGYKIGLHTSGFNPHAITKLANQKTLDWVGLDYKTIQPNYPALTGTRNQKPHLNFQKTLNTLQTNNILTEIRTTTHPALHTPQTLKEMGQNLQLWGITEWVLQEARLPAEPAVAATGKDWLEEVTKLVEDTGISFRWR